MTLAQRFAALFNVRENEQRPVFLFILYYFFLAIGFNFTLSVSFALFVAEFGPQKLPFAYMTVAVVVSGLAYIYLRLSQRLPFRQMIGLNIAFLALVSLIVWFGLSFARASWIVFLLPVWFQAMVSLANLAFWGLAGSSFDVRQSKRLFGLIGSGSWLAATIAGFLVSPLVNWLGAASLYFLAGISMVIALAFQRQILRIQPKPAESPTTQTTEASARPEPAGSLFRNRYILLILALVVLWWLGFYFVDNIFYDRAASQFPDANQLASVIGTMVGIEGIIALFTSFFFSSWLMSRFGLRAGLLIVPVMVGLLIGALAIIGVIDRTLALLFWLAALAKIINVAFGFSTDMSSRLILYQPLPDQQRVRAMTLADGIVQSLAIGLAGVFLLIFTTLLAFRAIELSWVFLLIVVGWIAIVFALMRQYPGVLANALRKRALGENIPLELSDSSSLAVLQTSLQSPYPEAVIYSLNLLRQVKPEAFTQLLPTLLEHRALEVRQEALRYVEELKLAPLIPDVERTLDHDSALPVREAALRALVATGASELLFEKVSAYLNAPELSLRRGAIIGLIRYGGLEGVLAAGQRLMAMTTSELPEERMLAAQILGEIGVRNFYQPLVPLLKDEDIRVRRTALLAAGKIGHPQLWSEVTQALELPEMGRTAVEALVIGREETLPSIRAALVAEEEVPRAVQIELIRVCGRIRGPQVTALLEDRIDLPDSGIRTHVLAALAACGYRASGEAANKVQQQIKTEAAEATWILAVRQDLGDDEAVKLLATALDQNLSQTRERIFYLLSFLYEPQSVLRTRRAFLYGDANQRAYAMEVLDSLLPSELKAEVFPLIDEFTASQRLQKLAVLFPQTPMERADRLKALVDDYQLAWTPWTQACAIYTIGRLGLSDAEAEVKIAVKAAAPVVRETGSWALERLRQSAKSDSAASDMKGNGQMLTTIEKVIILKTVSIFAGIPDDVLAEVASIVEEVEFKAGEQIFAKGDLGSSMYIIVNGKVEVRDGESSLNMLEDRDVFGEMALLDPEPRMASVTAVEDSRLFRLGQEPFYELVEDYGEVARGIIRVLAGRLRSRVNDVAELHNRIQELEKLTAANPQKITS